MSHIKVFNVSKFLKNLWIGIFITSVGVLMVAQIALTIPQAREVLSPINDVEEVTGSPGESSLLVGELTLSLQGVPPSSDIRILQNGTPIAFFSEPTMTIRVQNNSLIEIDGTKVADSFVVNIQDHSINIVLSEGKNSANVNSNISILTRIFIN